MIQDLILKFVVTPENVMGLLWNIVTIVCMCLIFRAWKEKWWKSLVPIYGTYIIYKHTWQKWKWLFLVQLAVDFARAKSISFAKKHVTTNLFSAIQTYVETEQIDIDISVEQLAICLILFLISSLITFILTRITYMKVCDSLMIKNVGLKIGTFLLPEVFLLVDYIYYTWRQKKKAQPAAAEVPLITGQEYAVQEQAAQISEGQTYVDTSSYR